MNQVSVVVNLVLRLPLFACVPEHEVADILGSARRRTYQRGQVIHHVDDVAGDVFIIVKGHVKHRLLASDGRQITHNIQNPVNFFGMMSVLDGKRRAGDSRPQQLVASGAFSPSAFVPLASEPPGASFEARRPGAVDCYWAYHRWEHSWAAGC